MSTIYQLTSASSRIPEALRRRRTGARSSLASVQAGKNADVDASSEARQSFISQCTQRSLQVWRQRAHFGTDESA
jgi:hypothetical protein